MSLLLAFRVPDVPSPLTARAPTHSCVPLVWGGWEGGHSRRRGREVWFEPHGVYNLQRDRPPWLPEGDGPGALPSILGHIVRAYTGGERCLRVAGTLHPLPALCPQMGKAEGVINAEIPNCWECPRCTQEGRTSKVGAGAGLGAGLGVGNGLGAVRNLTPASMSSGFR